MKAIIIYIVTSVLISCRTGVHSEMTLPKEKSTKEWMINNSNIDNTQEDTINIIRENFQRINAIKKWSVVESKELNQSTEGGVADYYYLNGKLEKIITRQYGEIFQLITEYYLMDNQLSFVFEKYHQYQTPVYDASFNIEHSTIIESRSYFHNGRIIHYIKGTKHSSYTPVEEKEELIKKQFIEVLKIN